MFDHQRRWWDLPNFVKALVGGFGSGKTSIGGKRIISLALENAPAPVAVVSPTFAMARETVIVTIDEFLKGKQSLLGRGFHYRHNRQFHQFIISYHGRRGRILVYSGDNPDSLRGPNLAAAWIDEPFIQDVDVARQMVARIRHPLAVRKELLLTGTPEQLNWGYDLCSNGVLYDTVDERGDPAGAGRRLDVGMVVASTEMNLAIGRDYVERLKHTYSDRAAQAYIYGQFVNLGTGLVYYGFDPRLSKVDDDGAIPDGVELGVGMDFNVDPMAAVVFWRSGDRLHFFDEIELPNADTQYMADILRERYGRRLQYVYPDATGSARRTSSPGGKSDFNYLQDAGFVILARSENPKRRDRYNSVNGRLRAGPDGQPRITISSRCRHLVKYLLTYSHERMNETSQRRMSHLLDAFSYPVAYLFPADRETVTQRRLTGY